MERSRASIHRGIRSVRTVAIAWTQGGSVTASETPPVRIGVVGAGFMGRQHIDFIRAAPGAALAAVADPGRHRGCVRLSDVRTPRRCSTPSSSTRSSSPTRTPCTSTQRSNASRPASRYSSRSRSPSTTPQSCRLVDAVARLHGRLLVGHHRRHHPAVARARSRDPRRRARTGRRRQRTLVGAQGGRLLHRHAVAPPSPAPA